jgi:hypothetical protein
MPVRMLVIEDEPLARERLIELLKPDAWIDVIGEAVTGLPGAAEQKSTLTRPVYWTLQSRVRPPCLPEVLGVVPTIRWQPERVA